MRKIREGRRIVGTSCGAEPFAWARRSFSGALTWLDFSDHSPKTSATPHLSIGFIRMSPARPLARYRNRVGRMFTGYCAVKGLRWRSCGRTIALFIQTAMATVGIGSTTPDGKGVCRR